MIKENEYIIKRPIVSEKSAALTEVAGRYVFEVARQANKLDVKRAVEKLFGVRVAGVNTMMQHGKFKRFGRTEKKRPNWKKAIVTLEEGQKIDFFQASNQ